MSGGIVAFAKMHSMGNDFMVANLIRQPVKISPEWVRQWSDRRTGVGFDQLLTLEPPRDPQQDFACRVFNADGSPSGSCYNGARCLGLFARRDGLTSASTLRIGFVDGDEVELRLGLVDGDEADILLLSAMAQMDAGALRTLGSGVESGGTIALAGQDYQVWPAVLGNPHAVVLDNPEDRARLQLAGEAAQAHPWFPQGVNLSFVRNEGEGLLKAGVYERGAGVTPACGSAVVAIASVALHLQWAQSPVRILMSDPDRPYCAVVGADGRIELSGPATLSYRGQLDLPDAEQR